MAGRLLNPTRFLVKKNRLQFLDKFSIQYRLLIRMQSFWRTKYGENAIDQITNTRASRFILDGYPNIESEFYGR